MQGSALFIFQLGANPLEQHSGQPREIWRTALSLLCAIGASEPECVFNEVRTITDFQESRVRQASYDLLESLRHWL